MAPDLPLDKPFVAAEDFPELAEHLSLSGHPYRMGEPLYQEVGWAEVLALKVFEVDVDSIEALGGQ